MLGSGRVLLGSGSVLLGSGRVQAPPRPRLCFEVRRDHSQSGIDAVGCSAHPSRALSAAVGSSAHPSRAFPGLDSS